MDRKVRADHHHHGHAPPTYRWLDKPPGMHAMRNATLGFCGVKRVHARMFGSVWGSTAQQREACLEKARRAGFRLHDGVRSGWARRWCSARNRVKFTYSPNQRSGPGWACHNDGERRTA